MYEIITLQVGYDDVTHRADVTWTTTSALIPLGQVSRERPTTDVPLGLLLDVLDGYTERTVRRLHWLEGLPLQVGKR